MRQETWELAHQKQLILDGTFGVCDSRVLLFIAMAINEAKSGVPLAFFLFLAPAGNKATHAGYDMKILTELLLFWRNSLGTRNGMAFTPSVAITDTDTRNEGP
jgi:hypothetical protein